MYVLSGTDLRELRKIPMSGPAEEVRSYKNKSGVHPIVVNPNLRIFEVSPVGHKVAAIWGAGFSSGQVEVYDLDSGEQLNEWNTGDRRVGIYPPKALQWEANGLRFVIAAPNAFPCMEPGNQPDLFVVDALTGTIPVEMTTGLLVGGIAVTPDDRVWAVDFDCLGVFVNHAPKMKVFDLHTGKRLRELTGRGSGVRFAVSASGNGNRVAAYSGKMKAHFDWGDMVPFDETIDRTFTVWNANSYEAILTSQDVTDPRQQQNLTLREPILRISMKGGFVLFGQNIYELPN